MKKIILVLFLILVGVMTACQKEVSEKIETETFAVEKETPKEIDIDTLITKALLKHYDEQFGKTDAPYKTTGYKAYLIEDISPNEKRMYGLANYMEYNLEDGNPVNTAGSGPTGIVITFTTDGKESNVDYEILTDGDIKSEEFKNIFPSEIQEKFNPVSMEDRNEVIKKQEEMLKKLTK